MTYKIVVAFDVACVSADLYSLSANSMEQSPLEKLVIAQLVKKFHAFYGS
jgi:hypothetical protein